MSFAPGLDVLCGETGAGKTIIIDALGLLLGTRIARHDSRRCKGGVVRTRGRDRVARRDFAIARRNQSRTAGPRRGQSFLTACLTLEASRR
ncbi:MAG: AAA family ATPase [Candidatus Binataceae bacterium]